MLARRLRLVVATAGAIVALHAGRTVNAEPHPAALCDEAARGAVAASFRAADQTSYQDVLQRLGSTVATFIAEHGPNEEASLHCLNFYARALLSLGEVASAKRVYAEAVDIALAEFGPNDDGTLTLQGNLAIALSKLGELDAAVAKQREVLAAREGYVNTPRAPKLAITLLNLAESYGLLGEIDGARAVAQRGWDLARDVLPRDDPRYVTAQVDYALALDRAGLRLAAQKEFEAALLMVGDAHEPTELINILASLAASFYDVGRFDEAQRRYAEAYALAARNLNPLHPLRAVIARSWCRALDATAAYADALSKCELALHVLEARGEGDSLEGYRTRLNVGVTLGLAGDHVRALAELRSAHDGLRDRLPPAHPEVLEASRALAVALIQSNDLDGGAARLRGVLEDQRRTLPEGHPDTIWTMGDYGVALAMSGNTRDAEAVLREYSLRVDDLRSAYGFDEGSRVGLFSRVASTRMFLAKLLISQQRCADAFDWIESTKARSTVDRIRERTAVSDSDRAEAAALERLRARLYVERAQAAGNGRLQSALDSRVTSINKRLQVLAAESPTRTAAPASAAQWVQRSLGARRGVLSYAIVEDEIVAVTFAQQTGFQCQSLGRWPNLESTVAAAGHTLATVKGIAGLMTASPTRPARRVYQLGSREFATQLRSERLPSGARVVVDDGELLGVLGRELFATPAQRLGQVSHVVVSPDGPLGLLAFDGLYIGGERVVQRFAVSQVAAVRMLESTRRPRTTARARVPMMVVGNPNYSTLPAPPGVRLVHAGTVVRGGDDTDGSVWGPLPASAVEIAALRRIYSLAPGATLFTGQDATVRKLRELDAAGNLAAARFLVFSTHAFADLTAPELSSIILTTPAGGAPRDAYLTAAELGTFHLTTDLVFFSACETGVGQVISGEGVLGLSVAVAIAGSRASVHTLWRVVDASAAKFGQDFFRRVKQGQSPLTALTNTKRDFLRSSALHDPAYWAPYVLSGTVELD